MERDKRYTPPEMYKELQTLTGVNWRKAMDPSPRNPKRDGLARQWRAKYVYLNPPFSELQKWVHHATDQWHMGNIKKGLVIVVPWYAHKPRAERGHFAKTDKPTYMKGLKPKKIFKMRHGFLKPDGTQYATKFEIYCYFWKR